MAVKIASTRLKNLVPQSDPRPSSKTLTQTPTLSSTTVGPYVRNPSWPTLPTVTSVDEKFVGLYAVFPGDGSGNGANFFAINCAGAYTVNFGDGSAAVNTATGVTTSYEYNYNNTALNNTDAPVTLTDAGDLITRSNHGYTNGMPVQFYNIVSTTGLTEGASYYVISAATNTFQISTSVGGSAVALTTNGTATLLPYKLAIVTITPQAGNNITSVSMDTSASIAGTGTRWAHSWVELKMSLPSLTAFSNGYLYTNRVPHLQAVDFVNIVSCSLYRLFNYSAALIYLNIGASTTGPTNANGIALACSSLVYFSMSSTVSASITDMALMFSDCFALQSVSSFNTAAVTNMSSMFYRCYSLQSVPAFNTAAVTNMNSMFYGCSSLRSAPSFNTAAVTNMSSMFYGCSSLQTVPPYDAPLTTDMSGMFYQCWALHTVPAFKTSACTTMSLMFYQCYSLQTAPAFFNTAAVTNMSSMFYSCFSLQSVPLFNTASVTTMSNMFYNCNSLRSVPLFNTAAVTNISGMFYNCLIISKVPAFNTAAVTNMSGMFYNCVLLQSVPAFNTAAVTTMASMFENCYSLQTAPLFNTAAVTDMSRMFWMCYSLKSVSPLNCQSVTNLSSMFRYCYTLVNAPILTNTGSGSIAASVSWINTLSDCYSLQTIPAYDLSKMPVTTGANWYNANGYNRTLRRIQSYGYSGSHSYSYFRLSGSALDEIYTNLPTASASAAITVTSNYGTATDTPSIATAKGWTVTGS